MLRHHLPLDFQESLPVPCCKILSEFVALVVTILGLKHKRNFEELIFVANLNNYKSDLITINIVLNKNLPIIHNVTIQVSCLININDIQMSAAFKISDCLAKITAIALYLSPEYDKALSPRTGYKSSVCILYYVQIG